MYIFIITQQQKIVTVELLSFSQINDFKSFKKLDGNDLMCTDTI